MPPRPRSGTQARHVHLPARDLMEFRFDYFGNADHAAMLEGEDPVELDDAVVSRMTYALVKVSGRCARPQLARARAFSERLAAACRAAGAAQAWVAPLEVVAETVPVDAPAPGPGDMTGAVQRYLAEHPPRGIDAAAVLELAARMIAKEGGGRGE